RDARAALHHARRALARSDVPVVDDELRRQGSRRRAPLEHERQLPALRRLRPVGCREAGPSPVVLLLAARGTSAAVNRVWRTRLPSTERQSACDWASSSAATEAVIMHIWFASSYRPRAHSTWARSPAIVESRYFSPIRSSAS